jgi:hypothetical protein
MLLPTGLPPTHFQIGGCAALQPSGIQRAGHDLRGLLQRHGLAQVGFQVFLAEPAIRFFQAAPFATLPKDGVHVVEGELVPLDEIKRAQSIRDYSSYRTSA